jgi:PTS system fructose-specific IIC component
MQYLQNIATALLDKEFNNIILTSNDKNKIIATISEAIESKKESDQVKTDTNTKGLIVGVSACATGVAHTYMAREALEKSASEIGYDI